MKWRKEWREKNPDIVARCEAEGIDPDKFHAWRGTQVHSCLEAAMKGEVADIASHDWIAPFWRRLETIVPDLRSPIWSEGPIDGAGFDWPADVDFSFHRELADGTSEKHYHIWNEEHGYVGTPDNICTFGTMFKRLTLFDLKTCEGLYSSRSPSSGGKNPSGYYKYVKTMKQLALYDMGFAERTPSLNIQQWGIIVLSERQESPQIFLTHNPIQMDKFRVRAVEQVHLFRQHHPQLYPAAA
ncbi:hypothetical protein [Nodosilinea nodulosa]|uniref:hypothetical protein n=1 Tax=Nodosilinea nodulosa TaxID=416001 RepID=UPI0002DE28F3|nr:hypothetical protein [Nodosilinea nodulosa]